MSFYTQTPPPIFSNEPPPMDATDDDDDFDDFQVASSDSMQYDSFPNKNQFNTFPTISSPSNNMNSFPIPSPPHNYVEMNHVSLPASDSPTPMHIHNEETEYGNDESVVSKPSQMDATECPVQYSIPALQPPPFLDNGELSSGSPSDVESDDSDDDAMEYDDAEKSFQQSDCTDGVSPLQSDVLNPLQLGEYISHVADNCQSSHNPRVLTIPSSTPSEAQLLYRSMDETMSSQQNDGSVDEVGDFSSMEGESKKSDRNISPSNTRHDSREQTPPILSNIQIIHENDSSQENLHEDANISKENQEKETIEEEFDDDFGEFADFSNMAVDSASSQAVADNHDQKSSSSIPDHPIPPADPITIENDDGDDFGEFEDFETKIPVSNVSPNEEAPAGHHNDDDDNDVGEFQDFANFQEASTEIPNVSKPAFSQSQSSVKSSAPKPLNEYSGGTLLERLADKIEPLMATCFQGEISSQKSSTKTSQKPYHTALGEAEDRLKLNMDQRCKELLCYLEDFEISRSVKYQWNDSHSYRDFLHLNRIDYESLVKSRQPALPAFACHMATTGGGVLEPQKVVGLSTVMKPTPATTASLQNGSSSGRASPRAGTIGLTRSNGSGTSLDVAEFDWSASGLVNPLQSGLDTELLSAADTTGLSQCFHGGLESTQTATSPTSTSVTMTKSISSGNLKSTASNVLHRFLVKPPSSSASQNSLQKAQILTATNLQQQSVGKNLDELSEPARDIVLRLPRIASYMNAKVLMFPLLSDRKSSIDSSVNN